MDNMTSNNLDQLLENNINHILRPHLTAQAFGLNWFFDIVLEP
jgi:hypothetical protein